MIVQKHKHIDGSVSYLKYKNGGYDMTIEVYNPATEETVCLSRERVLKIEPAITWMQERRKIW